MRYGEERSLYLNIFGYLEVSVTYFEIEKIWAILIQRGMIEFSWDIPPTVVLTKSSRKEHGLLWNQSMW